MMIIKNKLLIACGACSLLVTFARSIWTPSGLTWSWSGSNLFDAMIVYLKECFEEVSVGKPADNIYISHTHISKQTNYIFIA